MQSTADSPYGGQTAPRMVVNQARLIGRNLCFALGLWAAVGAYGGSWALGGLLASVLLLLMMLERRLLLREVSGTMQAACASAQIEGQRDAIAQVMSLELSYERLRSVLEALGEGVLVVDEVGEIVIPLSTIGVIAIDDSLVSLNIDEQAVSDANGGLASNEEATLNFGSAEEAKEFFAVLSKKLDEEEPLMELNKEQFYFGDNDQVLTKEFLETLEQSGHKIV